MVKMTTATADRLAQEFKVARRPSAATRSLPAQSCYHGEHGGRGAELILSRDTGLTRGQIMTLAKSRWRAEESTSNAEELGRYRDANAGRPVADHHAAGGTAVAVERLVSGLGRQTAADVSRLINKC